MAAFAELQLSGWERGRLRRARENGYLDARCRQNVALVHAYGLWCWRLKIPMVVVEKRSRYSRYGRVWLEMFTSGMRLSPAGQAVARAICAPANTSEWTHISPHDATWDHVALANAAGLAHNVFRASVRAGNYELNDRRVASSGLKKAGRVLQMEVPRLALG